MDIAKIREFIDYNPETGAMTWKKVMSNRTKAGSPCGANIDSKGYSRVCFDGKQYRAHRVAWAIFYGEEPVQQIDHINGNRTDNRIANLRIATNTENSRNCKISKNNTSGVTGVTYHGVANKWLAQITVNRKNVYLGIFANKEDAIKTRKHAESLYFGGFANNSAQAATTLRSPKCPF
jgi:hypothetical protein